MRTREEVIQEVEHLTETHSTLKEIDEVYFETLVQEAKKYKLWDEVVDVYCNWANFYINVEVNYDKAKIKLGLIKKSYIINASKGRMARFYLVLANFDRIEYKLALAIIKLNKALNFINEIKNKNQYNYDLKVEYFIYYLFHLIYDQTSDLNKSIQYLNKAKSIAETMKNEFYRVNCENKIGQYYFKCRDYVKAQKYFTKTIIYYEKYNLNYQLAWAKQFLANIFWELGQYDNALSHYLGSYKLFLNQYPKKQFCLVLVKIGHCYIKLNKGVEAREYFELAISRLDEIENKETMIEVIDLISEYQVYLRNFEKAIYFKKKIDEIREEINIVERTKTISSIEERYRTVLKRKEMFFQKKKQKQTEQILNWERSKKEQVKNIAKSLHKSLKQPVSSGVRMIGFLQNNNVSLIEKQDLIKKIEFEFRRIEQINQAMLQSFESETKGEKESLKAQNILSLLNKQLSGYNIQGDFPEGKYPQTHFIKEYITNLAQVSESEPLKSTLIASKYMGIML